MEENKSKVIRVMVEVPEDWIDPDSPTLLVSRMVLDEFKYRLMVKAVDEAVKQMKIPKIKYTEAELKKAVLDKMAQRVIDKMDIT